MVIFPVYACLIIKRATDIGAPTVSEDVPKNMPKTGPEIKSDADAPDDLTAHPTDVFRSNTVEQFWIRMSSLCEQGRPPRYADLDLLSLRQLAPNMTVLDVLDTPGELRIRYAGNVVTDMFGRETTGLTMAEVDTGPFRDKLLHQYARVVTTGQPQWSMADVAITPGNNPPVVSADAGDIVITVTNDNSSDNRDSSVNKEPTLRRFRYERLAFPLHDGTGTITQIASILVQHEPSRMDMAGRFEWHQMDLPKPH